MLWTLLAAIVASGTALYIAMFVYPRQKRQDRELAIHGEKRDAYVRFFSDLKSTNVYDEASKNPPKFVSQMSMSFSVLHLYSPKPVLEAAYEAMSSKQHQINVIKIREKVGEDLMSESEFSDAFTKARQAELSLLCEMRMDLHGLALPDDSAEFLIEYHGLNQTEEA